MIMVIIQLPCWTSKQPWNHFGFLTFGSNPWEVTFYTKIIRNKQPLKSTTKMKLDFGKGTKYFSKSICQMYFCHYAPETFKKFKRSWNVIFGNSRSSQFWFYKFEQLSSPNFTKIQSSESLKLPKMTFLDQLNSPKFDFT